MPRPAEKVSYLQDERYAKLKAEENLQRQRYERHAPWYAHGVHDLRLNLALAHQHHEVHAK